MTEQLNLFGDIKINADAEKRQVDLLVINFLQRNKLAWELFRYEREVMSNSGIIQKTKKEELRTKCRNRNLFLSTKIWELKSELQKHL